MPIQDLPYEILSAIFVKCLPKEPLDHKQPDLSQVPLLACHVCHYWRRVALTTPELWTRLYQIWIIPDKIHVADILTRGIRARDVEFMRWWLTNTGPLAAFLRLEFHTLPEASDPIQAARRFCSLDQSMLDALKHHLSSARYLDFDRLSATALRLHIPHSNYPNLETVLIRDIPWERERHIMHLSESLETILPINDMRSLKVRKLFLDRYHIYLPHVTDLVSWSNLTHVCIVEITIQTSTWFVLVREFRNLREGQFYLRMDPTQIGLPTPEIASLDHLHQLHMTWNGPLSRPHIFENLQMPSLVSLRIDSYLTIAGLHILLASTPALKELHLGHNTPWTPIANRGQRFPARGATIEPLSLYVPYLEYLLIQLDEESSLTQARMMQWVEGLLTNNWIKLDTPQHRIKQIELAIEDIEGVRGDLEDVIAQCSAAHAGLLVIRNPLAPKLWRTRSSYQNELNNVFDDMKFSHIT